MKDPRLGCSCVLPGRGCVCVGFVSFCIFFEEMWGDFGAPERVCGRVAPRKSGPQYGTVSVSDGNGSPEFLRSRVARMRALFACMSMCLRGVQTGRAVRVVALFLFFFDDCRRRLSRGIFTKEKGCVVHAGAAGCVIESRFCNILIEHAWEMPQRLDVLMRSYPRGVSGSRDPASQRTRADPTATTGHAGSSTPARACQMAVAVCRVSWRRTAWRSALHLPAAVPANSSGRWNACLIR